MNKVTSNKRGLFSIRFSFSLSMDFRDFPRSYRTLAEYFLLFAILFFRYGHFSGINRKVQLTYLPHGCPKTSSEEEGMS